MFFNSISSKLATVGLSFTIPIATMLSLMIAAKQKDINFATQENLGNRYQMPLEGIMEGLSQHRIATQRAAFGDSESAQELPLLRKKIEQSLAELNAINSKIGPDLQFTPDGLGKRKREEFTAERLTQDLTAFLAQDVSQIKTSEYPRFFSHIRTMITHAGDTSNLILDPDLDSYYLMDVTLLALPQIEDRIQEIATFVESIYQSGTISNSQRIQASVYAAFLKEADLDRVVLSSQTALNEDQNFYGINTSMQKTLPIGLELFKQSIDPTIAELKVLAEGPSPKSFDITKFRVMIDRDLKNTYDYHKLAIDELNNLLFARIGDIEANKSQAIIWTMLSLALSVVLFVAIAISLTRRVSRISQATRMIAGGNLAVRVGAQGGDELGHLARSFDQMTDNVERLNKEIAHKNADLQDVNQNLEQIVAERTVTINTILDNVKFGFLLIGRDLLLREGFSKSCHDLLEPQNKLRQGMAFREVFQLQGHRSIPLYESFLEQAFEDFLPEEMTLQQLPKRLKIGARILSIQVTSVKHAGQITNLLFTITDATNLEKAERENTKHKVLVRLLREIEAFRNYLEETKTRLTLARQLIRTGDQLKVRAELHTIKGNTAAFDLMDIAALVHNIEDLPDIEVDSIDMIQKEFELFLEENFEILQISFQGEGQDTLTIEQKHLDDIVVRIRGTKSNDELVSTVDNWVADMRYKQARVLIGALPEYGERLAQRFEKSVDIKLVGADTRMDPEVMRPIMHSLIHLVRNSIDHGMESSDERLDCQKSAKGTILIHCEALNDAWQVTFADDGRGINVTKVIQKALKSGHLSEESLTTMSYDQKLSLIFLSGMSTSENITDISGRGVGMSAVHHAVEEASGTLTVSSKEGQGTTIQIRIPRARESVYKKAS